MASYRQFRTYKTIPYRTGTEEVSNVYVYDVPSPFPSGAIQATLTAIKDLERLIHGSAVKFTRGDSQPMIGTPLVPQATDLSLDFALQAGSATNVAQHSEEVVMFQRRVGNRAWLRKYFHTYSCAKFSNESSGFAQDFWNATRISSLQSQYGDAIWSISVVVSSVTYVSVLSSVGKNDAGGGLTADNKVRIHELKY
jgi:hypothetical protein